MKYTLLENPRALEEARAKVAWSPRFALDCEAAGFHRYTDRLCLVQLSTHKATFLLDPLAADPREFLKTPLQDPDIQVVMHGADFDVRLLHRDLGLKVRGLFDTQIAASLVGEKALGLAALLEKHLGVKLSKKHQRADWAKRPLTEELLDYAAADTSHLLDLAAILEAELDRMGRTGWAKEEFEELEQIRWEEDASDPLTRVKGANKLSPRVATELRRALAWRDEIARERDLAPFRVAGDAVLMEVVQARPPTPNDLAALKGFSNRLARERGGGLLRSLAGVERLSDQDLQPYPENDRRGPGRPSPEEEAQGERLRTLRTRRSEELGLERGVLLSNATIGEVVRASPTTTAQLRKVPGIRGWQAEILGEEILLALEGQPVS